MNYVALLKTSFTLFLAANAGLAQDTVDSAELAKKLSNPIASLISVPFQLNYDEGFGTGDGQGWRLNIQPVIPFSMSDDWNLIVRTIVPLISQDDFAPGIGSDTGLGDITQSFFFSPAAPTDHGATWGVGPVFVYPTATDSNLGGEKWGAGLTGVA